jgi:hypothetical protein
MGGLRPDHLQGTRPPPCPRALRDYSGFALVIPKAFHGRSWKPLTRLVLQGKISPVFIRSIERAQERRIVHPGLGWGRRGGKAASSSSWWGLGCTAKPNTAHAFAPKGHGGQHRGPIKIYTHVCMYMIHFLRGGVGMGGGGKLYVSGYMFILFHCIYMVVAASVRFQMAWRRFQILMFWEGLPPLPPPRPLRIYVGVAAFYYFLMVCWWFFDGY